MNEIPIRPLNRREFLGAMSFAGVALVAGTPGLSNAAESHKIPIGLELYT